MDMTRARLDTRLAIGPLVCHFTSSRSSGCRFPPDVSVVHLSELGFSNVVAHEDSGRL